ncbi:hypothetical protein BaRGS_00000201, partial [Batillaria attramentaria]
GLYLRDISAASLISLILGTRLAAVGLFGTRPFYSTFDSDLSGLPIACFPELEDEAEGVWTERDCARKGMKHLKNSLEE